MRSVVYITLPQWFGSDDKSFKAAVWSHPSLQSVFALYLQERSALTKHHWIQQILKDMLVFCALVYIMVMKSTLLAWWKKMDPISQPQTKRQCVCPHGEKMRSQGTENQNFAQSPCSMPGVRVPAFPEGCDSLLLTNIIPKKKKPKNPASEYRASWQKRLHSCSSHFSNALLHMNHKSNMAKCADFCSFCLFCWN